VAHLPGTEAPPYRQDLVDALLSGDVQEARQIIKRYQTDLQLTQKELKTSLRDTFDAHSPDTSNQDWSCVYAVGEEDHDARRNPAHAQHPESLYQHRGTFWCDYEGTEGRFLNWLFVCV